MRATTKMTKAQRQARDVKRIAVGTFIAGAVVSIAANVVAANPTAIGRVVAGWPAVALLLTVHLFQHARQSTLVKIAIGAVAGVAAWASYWHMVEVATRAGENTVTAHLLPVTVDAMMAVATAVLSAKPATTAARKRAARAKTRTAAPARKPDLRAVAAA